MLAEKAETAATELLGSEAAAELKKDMWEVTRVPMAWSKEKIQAEMDAMGWDARVQFGRALPGSRTRLWFCKAEVVAAHHVIENVKSHGVKLVFFQAWMLLGSFTSVWFLLKIAFVGTNTYVI